MVIVDTLLDERARAGNPLRVGVIGAGSMSRGFINQIVRYMPGMRVAALCNRTLATARTALENAGVDAGDIVEANSAQAVDHAIELGKTALTDNLDAVCAAGQVEVLIEATGHIAYGAQVVLTALENGKSMVLMNAELDGSIGPLLKKRADEAGVILTGCDGDQPGVQLNLYRFIQSIGLRPLVCGNIKGLLDHYRNPTTQAKFAKQWDQTPHMVTSFADGTKIAFEQAIVGNATGMRVAQRGMIGPELKGHVNELIGSYDIDRIREMGGIVDYVLGAEPSPGVFVFAEAQDDMQRHYLNYAKLGEGPLYSFYVPYHLMVFEVPLSAARVALANDIVIAPRGAPVVDVIAIAKRDLKRGETLDGLGGYMSYGLCENYEIVRRDRLLPFGLVEGAVLTQDVSKDSALTYDDVTLDDDDLMVRLRAEQDSLFPS